MESEKLTFSPDVESDSDGDCDSEGEEGGGTEDDGEGPAPSPRVCAPVQSATIIHTAEADKEYKRQLAVLKQGAVGSSPPAGFVGTSPAPAPSTREPAGRNAKLAAAVAATIAGNPTPELSPSPSPVTLENALRSMKAIVRDQLGVDLSARGQGHPRTYGKAPTAWTPTSGPNKGA